MTDHVAPTEKVLEESLERMTRRRTSRRAGITALVTAAMAAGVAGTSTPAQATNQGAGPPDADILNFALNLEYLEAEYYLYAATGSGLPANLRAGTGRQGTTGRGERVPFTSQMIAGYAQNIAQDEVEHVRFIRNVLGGSAAAIPDIDVGVGPTNAFSQVAQMAGLVGAGQVFDPYLNDNNFLLGGALFTDVGVTAYAGAARFIGSPDVLEAASAILAVEAYHVGGLRTLIIMNGLADAYNKIETARATLSNASGMGSAEGPLNTTQANYDFVPADTNRLVFRRSTRQVLNIVYGAAGAPRGGFFPQGLNGNIKS